MPAVRVSPKYQVVIPRHVRDAVGIEPGQRVEVLAHGDRIEIVPIRPIAQMRGFLPGLDTAVERDDDRRP